VPFVALTSQQPLSWRSAFGRATEAGIFPAFASGFYFGLGLWCLLGFAFAFVFASHGTKYYTNGPAMRVAARPQKEKTMIHKHPVGAFTLKRESTAPGQTIDHDQILARYWELANLTPEETKGNITGQLKALEALCKELRLKPIDTNRPASQEVYRSAWMSPRPTRPN
jgi:hypothetical protein